MLNMYRMKSAEGKVTSTEDTQYSRRRGKRLFTGEMVSEASEKQPDCKRHDQLPK